MSQEHVYLGAYWTQRRESASQIIARCYRFLGELARAWPAMGGRCVVVGDQPVVLGRDYQHFEETLAKLFDDPRYVYENPDPSERSFSLDSALARGFIVTFSDPDPGATAETGASISVTAGAYGEFAPPNSVLVEIPASLPELRVRTKAAEALLEIVVAEWHPAVATLTSVELSEALDPECRSQLTPGILTYFADKRVVDVVGDTASATMRFGGALVAVELSTPCASSSEQLRPLHERLEEAGLLNLG